MTAKIITLDTSRSASWVQTASGRVFRLGSDDPAQVSMRDIAASLSKLNRFCGATLSPYSVAQHSVEVAEALVRHGPLYQLYGLLHDAHEAYLGDIPGPVKRVYAALLTYNPIEDLEEATQHVILKACHLKPPTTEIAAAVHAADMAVLAAERRDLMADCPLDWPMMPEPRPGRVISPWTWTRAEEAFLIRYRDLCVAAGVRPID